MAKIGIYVYTDMVKQRLTKKREGYFDGQNYIGLRYIVSEIDKSKHEITYVSKDTVNTVDYVLVSLTSYYDVANIINELYGKKITAKIIMGGAGCNNVGLLRTVADVITVGRGERTINRILDGDPVDGLWYKETNADLSKPVRIMPLLDYISIDDDFVGRYCEQSIGCQRKCFFCEYSWKHKWTKKEDGYHSGLLNRETLLQDVDWSSYHNKDLVTAIDGATEATRRVINKPIKTRKLPPRCCKSTTRPRTMFRSNCTVSWDILSKIALSRRKPSSPLSPRAGTAITGATC